MLPKKSYKQSHILPIGPEGEQLYFYGLSCIAIDLAKIMYEQNDLGLGWNKLPKNKSNVKMKIITRIMGLRKVIDDGRDIFLTKIYSLVCCRMYGAIVRSIRLRTTMIV